jgi:hypothetical protein
VDAASRHQKAEAKLIIPDGLRDQVAVGLLAEVRPEAANAVSRPTP